MVYVTTPSLAITLKTTSTGSGFALDEFLLHVKRVTKRLRHRKPGVPLLSRFQPAVARTRSSTIARNSSGCRRARRAY